MCDSTRRRETFESFIAAVHDVNRGPNRYIYIPGSLKLILPETSAWLLGVHEKGCFCEARRYTWSLLPSSRALTRHGLFSYRRETVMKDFEDHDEGEQRWLYMMYQLVISRQRPENRTHYVFCCFILTLLFSVRCATRCLVVLRNQTPVSLPQMYE